MSGDCTPSLTISDGAHAPAVELAARLRTVFPGGASGSQPAITVSDVVDPADGRDTSWPHSVYCVDVSLTLRSDSTKIAHECSQPMTRYRKQSATQAAEQELSGRMDHLAEKAISALRAELGKQVSCLVVPGPGVDIQRLKVMNSHRAPHDVSSKLPVCLAPNDTLEIEYLDGNSYRPIEVTSRDCRDQYLLRSSGSGSGSGSASGSGSGGGVFHADISSSVMYGLLAVIAVLLAIRVVRGRRRPPRLDPVVRSGGVEPDAARSPAAETAGNNVGAAPAAPRQAQAPDPSTHRILFIAANPRTTDPVELNQECADIDHALRLAENRQYFELVSKWAVTVDELARHLMEQRPTILHFGGHAVRRGSAAVPWSTGRRDVIVPDSATAEAGICLQADGDGAQIVTADALARLLHGPGSRLRGVVLNACYSDAQAETLCTVVDCVVGMTEAIGDDAARSFSASFYLALGNGLSIPAAVNHAKAILIAKQLAGEHLVRCRTRPGIDDVNLVLTPPVNR